MRSCDTNPLLLAVYAWAPYPCSSPESDICWLEGFLWSPWAATANGSVHTDGEAQREGPLTLVLLAYCGEAAGKLPQQLWDLPSAFLQRVSLNHISTLSTLLSNIIFTLNHNFT